MGSGQWEAIAKNPGFTTNAINKIKNDFIKYVAQLEKAIDARIKKQNGATVRSLCSSTPCWSIENGTRPKRAALNRASDFITQVNRMHKLKPRGNAAKGGRTAGRGRKRESKRPLFSESATERHDEIDVASVRVNE